MGPKSFLELKKYSKNCSAPKRPFSGIFGFFLPPDVNSGPFWVPKRVPGGYFFGVFSKTAILSKSRSRLGNNTIFEGRTVQKSVRRATPNGDPKQKRQKSVPAASPDAIFRSRARFCWILGSRPGPKIVPKLVLQVS